MGKIGFPEWHAVPIGTKSAVGIVDCVFSQDKGRYLGYQPTEMVLPYLLVKIPLSATDIPVIQEFMDIAKKYHGCDGKVLFLTLY